MSATGAGSEEWEEPGLRQLEPDPEEGLRAPRAVDNQYSFF